MEDGNGWNEWKNHVLAELRRLNDTLKDHTDADAANFQKLESLMVDVQLNLNTLSTKSKMWGSVAGGLVSGGVALIAAWLGK